MADTHNFMAQKITLNWKSKLIDFENVKDLHLQVSRGPLNFWKFGY